MKRLNYYLTIKYKPKMQQEIKFLLPLNDNGVFSLLPMHKLTETLWLTSNIKYRHNVVSPINQYLEKHYNCYCHFQNRPCSLYNLFGQGILDYPTYEKKSDKPLPEQGKNGIYYAEFTRLNKTFLLFYVNVEAIKMLSNLSEHKVLCKGVKKNWGSLDFELSEKNEGIISHLDNTVEKYNWYNFSLLDRVSSEKTDFKSKKEISSLNTALFFAGLPLFIDDVQIQNPAVKDIYQQYGGINMSVFDNFRFDQSCFGLTIKNEPTTQFKTAFKNLILNLL